MKKNFISYAIAYAFSISFRSREHVRTHTGSPGIFIYADKNFLLD